jgi:hypothetical protein
MGNSFANSFIEKQKELGMRSRLADMKQAKRQRDFTLAMNMSQTRDRVYWMVAFYTTMFTVGVTRAFIRKSIEPLPLKYM